MRELKVSAVSGQLHDDFKNIAAHKGITLSAVLAPKVRDIVGRFAHLIEPKPCEKSYFRIRGIGEKTKKELKAIADNMGIDVSDLLKMELQKDSETYPAHMKTPMIVD